MSWVAAAYLHQLIHCHDAVRRARLAALKADKEKEKKVNVCFASHL